MQILHSLCELPVNQHRAPLTDLFNNNYHSASFTYCSCPHQDNGKNVYWIGRRGDNWDTVSQVIRHLLFLRRKTDKAQYTGCSVHENNNGQATFENPMYNTNTKAAEGKVVRFDPNLNTICTMVWCLLSMRERQERRRDTYNFSCWLNMNIHRHFYFPCL